MNRALPVAVVFAGALIAAAILAAPQTTPEADRIRRARAACKAVLPPDALPIEIETCTGRVLHPGRI